MAKANFYVIVLSILLLIVLGIVVFSVKHKYYKNYDEVRKIFSEVRGYQAQAGLKNINLSCFFNACMQMLFSLDEFRMFVENSQSEKMPTVGAVSGLFRTLRSGEGAVGNIEYYKTIIKSIRSAEIRPGEENCASQFLELLIDKIVEEEAVVNEVNMDKFSNVSFEDFESFRQRMSTIRMFGFLVLPTGIPWYTVDYTPAGEGNDAIPLQIAWCIRTKACASMQDTFNSVLYGDIESTPTRMVVHNRMISKYLILNFGPHGFSLSNVKWMGNGEVQVSESHFSLVAMNLFRGNVKNNLLRGGSGHYMSCARRNGVWYLFDDSSVKKTSLQSLPIDLTVTSAVFERIDVPKTK